MKILLIVNDAPYGNEKLYNALRLAMTLQREHAAVELRMFLMADSLGSALTGQSTPNGYYNIERMMKAVIKDGGQIKACGSCARARGIKQLDIIDGIEISNMKQLTQWVVDSDKVINF